MLKAFAEQDVIHANTITEEEVWSVYWTNVSGALASRAAGKLVRTTHADNDSFLILALADEEMEVIVIMNREKKNTRKVEVGRHNIPSKPAIKYLGVTIDAKPGFRQHRE